MSSPDNIFSPNKGILPPVRRSSRSLPRRSALCATDIYEPFLFSSQMATQNTENSLIGKKSGDSLRSDSVLLPCMSSDPMLRITQLEQNLRFLQEQHQSMLNSLHQEIESLRIRNRDLQFQLIFGNTSSSIMHSSSDSSPDDTSKPKILLSPKEVNTRPLQVEILEKEVAELKAALNEANTKNVNLSQLVEFQKKQLEIAKKEKDSEHAAKIDESELLIKRLVKENEEQRKEVNNLRSQLNKAGGSGHRYNGRRGGGAPDYQRFPPLQSQNYWSHGSQKQRARSRVYVSSPEYHNGRGQMDQEVVGQPAPTLPHLTRTFSQPSQNRRHGYYSNGNHFYHGNGEEGDGRRRYRGRGGSGNNKEEN